MASIIQFMTRLIPDLSGRTWFILVGALIIALILVFVFTWMRTRKIRMYQDMLFKDALTGLKTSQYLERHFNDIVVGFDRDVALYYVNIDNFKNYNDIFGHHIADELLKAFASRIYDATAPEHTVYRVHSDRFIIIRPLENEEDGFSTTLLKTLKHPFYLKDHSIKLTVSIGRYDVNHTPPRYFNSVLRSELALEEAKHSGKDQVVVYSNALKQRSKKAFDMFHFIKDALNEDKFILEFQPIIETKSETIVGLESLLRVKDSTGMIFPDALIEYAEKFNMIEDIDRMVSQKALKHFKAFKDASIPLEFLSINISSKEIHNLEFIDYLESLTKKYRIKPEEVIIEFTETVDPESIQDEGKFIRSLKTRGFKVAIDDFGSGYSSMMRLSTNVLDRIKIDRNFVMNIANSKANQHIVEAMVRLAASFELDVIVEGVENKEDMEIIRSLDITYIQGYYYYRPLTPEQFEALYTDRS
ncbi:MAG: putative bifunctional diguanylate cyclase/phosphodiesterase [Bacillota bacterium]